MRRDPALSQFSVEAIWGMLSKPRQFFVYLSVHLSRSCWIGGSPLISMIGLSLVNDTFCLYAASLLVKPRPITQGQLKYTLNQPTRDSYTRCHRCTDIRRIRVLPVCQCCVARFSVKEVMTLLVNSKTLWMATLHPTVEGQRDRGCCVKQCSPMLLEMQ